MMTMLADISYSSMHFGESVTTLANGIENEESRGFWEGEGFEQWRT